MALKLKIFNTDNWSRNIGPGLKKKEAYNRKKIEIK